MKCLCIQETKEKVIGAFWECKEIGFLRKVYQVDNSLLELEIACTETMK